MPALLEYVRDEALPGREQILDRLASHDRDVVLRILTLLCPCRNVCYDADIWSKLPAIRESQWDFEVREAASHAIGTLHERARVDGRSRELVEQLAARLGENLYSPSFRHKRRTSRAERLTHPKLARRDVPTLIEALSSDDPIAIGDALTGLCPTDGRHVPMRVWHAIDEVRRDPDPELRAKAARAASRLDEHRARCGRHE